MPFVSECIWLYHDMKRICNQDPSLYLWCFQVGNSGFLSHNNDDTISNLGTMLSYCQSGLYLYPSLVICPIYTYVVSILQKIMRTCKIRFKSKHHQYRYPNKFDYITYRVSTVTFSFFFLPCYRLATRVFLCKFNRNVSPCTNCGIRNFIRSPWISLNSVKPVTSDDWVLCKPFFFYMFNPSTNHFLRQESTTWSV